MPRDRSNSPPPPLDGSAPGDVANQVRTRSLPGPAGGKRSWSAPTPARDLPAGNGDCVFAIGIHFLVALGLLLYQLILHAPPYALDRERRGAKGSPDDAHRLTNFAGHGQHVFAAIKLKTHDPSTLLRCIPASQCTWYAPQS